MNQGLLILVSAPSGAGKTSLVNSLVKKDQNLVPSISHTTRKKRNGEINGQDYFFVNTEHFTKMIQNEEFLEYADVFGNLYGTSKNEVAAKRASGLDVLLEIDWQGANKIQSMSPDTVSIFIMPPSLKELKNRLIKRDKDSLDIIEYRLSQAHKDISKARQYKYLVINDFFDKAESNLTNIIFAERLKTSNQIRNNVLVQALLSPT